MVRLLTFFVICICFVVFLRTYWIWQLNQARRKGRYPQKGEATLFDVRDLLQQGEKELAVQIYADIFKTSRKDAERAVEELAKGIEDED